MLTLAISLSAVVLPATAQAPSPAPFDGVWRLDHPNDEGRRIVDRAIDRAVEPMNYFVRAIAADRLREGTHINRRITLRAADDRLTVQFDDRDAYTTRIGRTTRQQGMRVTQRLRPNGQLEQVFETDEGTRWYVYTPLADGRMRVETTTGSPRMPEPMVFSLVYRRE
jgi:hypothetical protein